MAKSGDTTCRGLHLSDILFPRHMQTSNLHCQLPSMTSEQNKVLGREHFRFGKRPFSAAGPNTAQNSGGVAIPKGTCRALGDVFLSRCPRSDVLSGQALTGSCLTLVGQVTARQLAVSCNCIRACAVIQHGRPLAQLTMPDAGSYEASVAKATMLAGQAAASACLLSTSRQQIHFALRVSSLRWLQRTT